MASSDVLFAPLEVRIEGDVIVASFDEAEPIVVDPTTPIYDATKKAAMRRWWDAKPKV